MGLFTSFLGMIVGDTIKGASKTVAVTVNGVASTVGEGLDAFVDSSTQVAQGILKSKGKLSIVEELQEKQEARRLGLPPGVRVASLSPEQRHEYELLKAYKQDILACIMTLDDEIERLKKSVLFPLYRGRVNTKQIKKNELEKLQRSPDWQSLYEKAWPLLGNDKVVAGRHSRTKVLLEKMVTHYLACNEAAKSLAPR